MRIRKGFKIIGIVFIVLFFLFSGINLYLRQDSIRCAIEYGRLANIPESATRIKVKTRGNLFSRTFYLSFKAEKTKIDKWINGSSDLKKDIWINPKEERINHVKNGETEPIVLNEYAIRYGNVPRWFKIAKINDGEYYVIPWNEEHLHGEVWIDLKRNIVYIETSHS